MCFCSFFLLLPNVKIFMKMGTKKIDKQEFICVEVHAIIVSSRRSQKSLWDNGCDDGHHVLEWKCTFQVYTCVFLYNLCVVWAHSMAVVWRERLYRSKLWTNIILLFEKLEENQRVRRRIISIHSRSFANFLARIHCAKNSSEQ